MLRSIQKEFESAVKSSKELAQMGEAVRQHTATYDDAHRYAQQLSRLCTDAIRKYMTADSLPDGKLYYNIAMKVLGPMLKDTRTRISRYCYNVQAIMNSELGIRIQPASPEFNEERLEGLIEHSSDVGLENIEQALQFTESASETFNSSIVDDYVRENATRHGALGFREYVVRTASPGCCEWCRAQAGKYEYDGDSSHEYWKRHTGCNCTVKFISERTGDHIVWNPTMQRAARRKRR